MNVVSVNLKSSQAWEGPLEYIFKWLMLIKPKDTIMNHQKYIQDISQIANNDKFDKLSCKSISVAYYLPAI
jgi:hypothetical protein